MTESTIVVGIAECPVEAVIEKMFGSPVSQLLGNRSKWKDIVSRLGISDDLTRYNIENATTKRIYRQILNTWYLEKVNSATLDELIEVLEDENLNAIGEELRILKLAILKRMKDAEKATSLDVIPRTNKEGSSKFHCGGIIESATTITEIIRAHHDLSGIQNGAAAPPSQSTRNEGGHIYESIITNLNTENKEPVSDVQST